MSEPNSQSEKEKDQPRFSQEQYDMLKRCSDKEDVTEWNEWREKHPEKDVELDDQVFSSWHLFGIRLNSQKAHDTGSKVYLRDATFLRADLRKAVLHHAYLEGARFNMAQLQESDFHDAHVQRSIFYQSHIEGSSFRTIIVDCETSFWQARVDRQTEFEGTSLNTSRIDPATKQLLEYNIRRKNWEEWYKQHRILKWPVWLFWLMSDYGLSTGRIVTVFLGFAAVFAAIYYICGLIAPPGIVDYLFVDPSGVKVGWGLALLRAVHFSVVIMTVGFSNMHANAHSFWAHALVGFQMILGFVLLGALVTRFAVLFTAGGPAGRFAEEQKTEDRRRS